MKLLELIRVELFYASIPCLIVEHNFVFTTDSFIKQIEL